MTTQPSQPSQPFQVIYPCTLIRFRRGGLLHIKLPGYLHIKLPGYRAGSTICGRDDARAYGLLSVSLDMTPRLCQKCYVRLPFAAEWRPDPSYPHLRILSPVEGEK